MKTAVVSSPGTEGRQEKRSPMRVHSEKSSSENRSEKILLLGFKTELKLNQDQRVNIVKHCGVALHARKESNRKRHREIQEIREQICKAIPLS